MATVLTPFDIGGPEQSQQQKQGPAPTFNATPSTAIGGSGVAAPGAPGASTAPAGAQPSTAPAATNSGGFQNIQKYLGANAGFDAAKGGLAGEITSNVQGQANNANQALQGVFNQFNQQAGQAASNFSDPSKYQNTVTNAVSGAATATPDQIQQVNQLANSQYNGPTQVDQQSLANIKQQNLGNLQNLAQNTQSESGRFNLLNQMFNKPGYNQGQQSLDNLFLQNNPQQTQQLKSLGNIANNFNQNIGNVAQQSAATGQQDLNAAQQASQFTRQNVNQALGNTYGKVTDTSATGQLATDQGAFNTAASNVLKGVESGQLTQKDLDFLQSQGLYKANPLGDINGAPLASTIGANGASPFAATQLSAAQAMTPQQQQSLQALNQMLGGSGSAVGNLVNANYANLSNFLTPEAAAQAGTYASLNPYAVDATKLQQYQDAAYNGLSPELQHLAGGVMATGQGAPTKYDETWNPTTHRWDQPIDNTGQAYHSIISGTMYTPKEIQANPQIQQYEDAMRSAYQAGDTQKAAQIYEQQYLPTYAQTAKNLGVSTTPGQIGQNAAWLPLPKLNVVNDYSGANPIFDPYAGTQNDLRNLTPNISHVIGGSPGSPVMTKPIEARPAAPATDTTPAVVAQPAVPAAAIPGLYNSPTGVGMTQQQQAADRAAQLAADQAAQVAAAQQAAQDAATAQKAAIGQQTLGPSGLNKLGHLMRGSI
jgi:hypothetical protein